MPGKRKGPDPEEERRQLEELKQTARKEYLALYKKEERRSAGHRSRGTNPGKVPGFDPNPQAHIGDAEVDRLIIRRGVAAKQWEDPADDEAPPADAAGDPEGIEVQEQLRQTQSDLMEILRLIQCEVDGLAGRAEIEVAEADATAVEDAVDADADADSGRDLGPLIYDFFASSGPDTEVAVSEVTSIADTVQALWRRKKELHEGGLMVELCKHLACSRGLLAVLQQAVAVQYAEKNPGRTYAELMVLFLYSCEPSGIARVLCMEGAKMPPIHQIINKALRQRDLKVMFDWICFISVLMGTSTRLAPDKVGRTVQRGIKGLSQEQMAVLKQAKPDELHFLPPLTSLSFDFDAAVGEEYKAPDAAVFTVRGVRAGTDITNCAQFGKDQEVLLPPLTCLKVKEQPKFEQGLRITYDYIGAIMHTTPTGDLPYFRDEQRKAFRAFVRDVRDHCRTLDKELRLLQRYQAAHRRMLQHRRTLHELAEAISTRESEKENAQRAIEQLPRGAKPPPSMVKPEDVQALLDADKCRILRDLSQLQKIEQERLERELHVLKGAIDGGTEELMRTDVDTVDTDLRPLVKLQTEHYNGMVKLYEKDATANDKLDLRLAALQPADTKKKKAKGGR
eukprot:TRINITY_DN4002_c4_g1_i1.p1 TRINITY_DN4002_c4_g1~~TRINITY_DN4002_c4_g1_i1.p1  ORF type:complete len:621 (+),score=269.70 TRINITY_DN4002_c4_g1_i1:64-1926(+)